MPVLPSPIGLDFISSHPAVSFYNNGQDSGILANLCNISEGVAKPLVLPWAKYIHFWSMICDSALKFELRP